MSRRLTWGILLVLWCAVSLWGAGMVRGKAHTTHNQQRHSHQGTCTVGVAPAPGQGGVEDIEVLRRSLPAGFHYVPTLPLTPATAVHSHYMLMDPSAALLTPWATPRTICAAAHSSSTKKHDVAIFPAHTLGKPTTHHLPEATYSKTLKDHEWPSIDVIAVRLKHTPTCGYSCILWRTASATGAPHNMTYPNLYVKGGLPGESCTSVCARSRLQCAENAFNFTMMQTCSTLQLVFPACGQACLPALHGATVSPSSFPGFDRSTSTHVVNLMHDQRTVPTCYSKSNTVERVCPCVGGSDHETVPWDGTVHLDNLP